MNMSVSENVNTVTMPESEMLKDASCMVSSLRNAFGLPPDTSCRAVYIEAFRYTHGSASAMQKMIAQDAEEQAVTPYLVWAFKYRVLHWWQKVVVYTEEQRALHPMPRQVGRRN